MTPEIFTKSAPTSLSPEPTTVQVILVDGANPIYLPMAEKVADIFRRFLADFEYLSDGQGNCGLISAIAHAVATSAGYKPRLLGGNCLNNRGQSPFGRRGGHFWIEMPDGTVIDGAGTARVQIYRPDDIGYRMIPIIGHRRNGACMRKTKQRLDLSSDIQEAIVKRGSDFRWSSMEVA